MTLKKQENHWIRTLVALLCLSVGGCALSLEEQFAVEAKRHCASFLRQTDLETGTAKVSCLENALVRAGQKIEHRDVDLLELRRDYLVALSTRVDRGEVTQAEAAALKTELELRLRAEIRHRDQQAGHLQSMRDASLAALRHDVDQWIRSR